MNTLFLEYNDEIIKIEILFDKENLKNIRDDIFYNCSKVEEKKNIQEYFTNFYDINREKQKKNYVNYTYNIIKHPEDNGDLVHASITPGIISISYDYYDYPEVIDKLDEIINCNDNSLINKWSNLLQYLADIEKKTQVFLEDKFVINNLDDLRRANTLYQELEEYLKILEYLNDIENMLDFNIIGSYSKEDLKQFESFFNLKLQTNIIKKDNFPINLIHKLEKKPKVLTKINQNNWQKKVFVLLYYPY